MKLDEDRQIRLRDGRWLGYAEYGAPEGQPVVAFHGTPGSRLMLRAADPPARRRGIRIIAPDRPGYGLSSPQPGRSIADWPDDMVELADALRLPRFAVVGISGGGPYAAACAWKIPERLTVVGIISGMGPLVSEVRAKLVRTHRTGFALMQKVPPLVRVVMLGASAGWHRAPDRLMSRIHGLLPAVDQAIVARPEVRDSLRAGLREAFRQGGRGASEELLLFARPWTFALGEIRAPIRLWHGEADPIVPPVMGHYAARTIPGCRAEFIARAGHYWVFDHIDELLEALAHPLAEPLADPSKRSAHSACTDEGSP